MEQKPDISNNPTDRFLFRRGHHNVDRGTLLYDSDGCGEEDPLSNLPAVDLGTVVEEDIPLEED
jgi:hypothetical protein